MDEVILIVDDETPKRYTLRRLLEISGYAVLEAESGEEALELAERVSIDLVVTDLKMPEMDGLTLARHLLEQDPARPVILMAANSVYRQMQEMAAEIGVYGYFAKPFEIKNMMSGIRGALESRPAPRSGSEKGVEGR